MVWWILLLICVLLGLIYSYYGFWEIVEVRNKAVFISGCDTGFGQGLALRLDKLGMKVFAGCLTTKGADDLQAKGSAQLVTIICDIAKEDDVQKAAEKVSKDCPEGIWALVNNAGILFHGEWDWQPMSQIRSTFEVNFFGHVLVTKAFLPLLKKTKGRIVNLTSVAGVIATGTLGVYSCSKFAMEAFSDSLRIEMKRWGIQVFIIEPTYSGTPMVSNFRNVLQKTVDTLPLRVKEEYGDNYFNDLLNLQSIPNVTPIDMVLDALEDKIKYKYPPLRHQIGFSAKLLYVLKHVLPASWVDFLVTHYRGRRTLPIPVVLSRK